jgi:hypothetical protein
MDKLFELLGLGKPFVYAAGTFAFFYWLDSNASDEAKKELARLVSVKDLQPKAVSVGITELFDRVYTPSLFSWRAFVRSSSITLGVSILYMLELGLFSDFVSVSRGSRHAAWPI